jgi:acetyl esterase/lipase
LPNYRLIPEHNGHDILSDIFTFWKWFNKDLSNYVSSIDPNIQLDFEKLLVTGDSAGGHMSIHSALMTPPSLIKAMLLQYPMTSYLNREATALFNDQETPGPEVIDDYISAIVPGTIVSSFVPPERMNISFALSTYGRWQEFFGYTKGLLPIEAIENATSFPPTWIVHGERDTAVSVEDSKAFVRKIVEVLGDETKERVRLHVESGKDHGFDGGLKEEDTLWLKEGLKWVEGQWLA